MTRDAGNRSFFALLAVSLIVWQAIGIAACVVFAVAAYRLAADGGIDSTTSAALVPAAVFLGVVGLGAALGIRSLMIQLRHSRRLAKRVRALRRPAPPGLDGVATRLGLGRRVRYVDSREAFSFAYGALRPRVAVSRGLVYALTEPELEAVLVHERYHVHNLDPLKVVVSRALPDVLFYLPALRGLRARYVAGRELAADDRAMSSCGRGPLAGALMKVLRAPRWPELGAAAAIGGPELIDVRIAQMEGAGEARMPRPTLQQIVVSIVGVAVLSGALVASVAWSDGLTAAVRTTMPEADGSAVGLLSMAACSVPWLIVGWAAYRWLGRRAAQA